MIERRPQTVTGVSCVEVMLRAERKVMLSTMASRLLKDLTDSSLGRQVFRLIRLAMFVYATREAVRYVSSRRK